MGSQIYRRTMEAARRAKRDGIDPALVAPPVGNLRDAFMLEYDRCQARRRVVGMGVCAVNCDHVRIGEDGIGECPNRDHWL